MKRAPDCGTAAHAALRRLIPALSIALLAGAVQAQPTGPDTPTSTVRTSGVPDAGVGADTRQFTLPNGMTLIVRTDRDRKSVV